jgi:ligand-binding sensor domain-containing protein
MKFIRQLKYILFSFFFASQLCAQELNWKNFASDKLQSTESYCVIQDKEGFIWVSTDRGVSRYDGYEFEHFTTDDGLLDNVVFKMFEDALGRIWMVSFNLELCYFQKGKFYPFKYNHLLKEVNYRILYSSFYVDRDENVWLSYQNGPMVKISKQGVIEEKNKFKDASMQLYELEGQILESSKGSKVNSKFSMIFGNSTQNCLFEWNAFRRLLVIDSNEVLLSSNNILYQWKRNHCPELIEKFGQNIICLKKHNNQLWVCRHGLGISIYERVNGKWKWKYNLMEGHSVSEVLFDENSGIWVTTLDNGLYYTRLVGELVELSSKIKNNISAIATGDNQEVLIATYDGDIYYKESNTADWKKHEIAYSVREILYNKSDSTFYLSSKALYACNAKGLKIVNKKNCHHVDFDFLGEGFVLSSGITELSRNGQIHSKQPLRNFSSVYAVSKDEFYLGYLDGAYHYKKGKLTHLKSLDKRFNIRVSEIVGSQNKIFFATRGKGIIVKEKDTIYTISTADGLIDNQINNLTLLKNGDLLVATHKGLSWVKFAEGIEIVNFSELNGLINNEVMDVAGSDDFIWIGTKKGVQKVTYEETQKKKKIGEIKIRNFITGDKIIKEFKQTIELPYEKSYFEIEFSALNYSLLAKTKYKYRLSENEAWRTTTTNKLQFPFLSPGDYLLQITEFEEGDTKRLRPLQIHIRVLEPFYRTTNFLIIIFIVLFLLVISFFWLRLRKIKEKEKIKTELSLLRSQAMSAQMNPHFIFNSLNSIQRFILKNDRISSSKYLSKFAKLIRYVLDYSQKTYVTVEEELLSLESYIELEKLRFKDILEYEFIIDPKINRLSTFIPPLLIQPFIENAIWHGIMPVKEGGRVTVEFKVNEIGLNCLINDNGVGMEASKGTTVKGHQSFSIENCKKRLELFHQNNIKLSEINYSNGIQGQGTSVSFYLPFKIKFEK